MQSTDLSPCAICSYLEPDGSNSTSHILFYFIKYFNITLPHSPKNSKWSLPSRFPAKIMYVFLISPILITLWRFPSRKFENLSWTAWLTWSNPERAVSSSRFYSTVYWRKIFVQCCSNTTLKYNALISQNVQPIFQLLLSAAMLKLTVQILSKTFPLFEIE